MYGNRAMRRKIWCRMVKAVAAIVIILLLALPLLGPKQSRPVGVQPLAEPLILIDWMLEGCLEGAGWVFGRALSRFGRGFARGFGS